MTPAEMQADIAERIANGEVSDPVQLRRRAEFMINTANAVLEAPPAERAALYQRAKIEGAGLGLDMSHMPERYGPATETYLLGMWKVAGHVELVTRGPVTAH